MTSYVYIIVNKGYQGLIKIGYTDRHPDQRAEDLDDTGSPYPFMVAYHAQVNGAHKVEQQVHRLLKSVRVRKNREWFRCSVVDGIVKIREAAAGAIIQECDAEKELEEASKREQAEREQREQAEREQREQEQEQREWERQKRKHEFYEWLKQDEERRRQRQEQAEKQAALQREQNWKKTKAAIKAVGGWMLGVPIILMLLSSALSGQAPQPQPQMTMPQAQPQVEESQRQEREWIEAQLLASPMRELELVRDPVRRERFVTILMEARQE